ncbi:hypothetical protein [Nitrosopumilus sp. S6]
MNKGYRLGLIFVIISGVGLGLTASAEEGGIPAWIKNTALWYGEGQVSDTEFINALQYLISQDILSVPITSVLATNTNLSDNDRAMSIVVHYNGEIFTAGETIYTYSEFQHLSSVVRTSTNGIQTVASSTPQFYLSGLPSEDKKTVYRLVDEYVNPGRPPAQYDIQVDILTGDGKVIQTWDYRNCDIVEYVTYLDSNKDNYRFSEKDDVEIREVILWECTGFRLLVD